MFISEKTLDDLMRAVFAAILKRGVHINSSKGSNTEISGVLLEPGKPGARCGCLKFESGSNDRAANALPLSHGCRACPTSA
jgi:hypothetical protein